MSRLEDVKNEVAKELGYNNYSDLFDKRNITNSVVDMVAEKYAQEVAIASLEKASKYIKIEINENNMVRVDFNSITNPDNIVLL